MQRSAHGFVLILLGAVLILVPAIGHAIVTAMDKERVAEFYAQNANGAMLPESLRPSDHSPYDWACFGVGAGLMLIGVRRTAVSSATGKPSPWARSEV